MSKFDFLEGYVLKLLDDNGLGNLSDEQKGMYVPQLLTLLEERVGLKLLPLLDDKGLDEFNKILEQDSATAETWKNFWYQNIPNFEDHIKDVLMEFADKVEQILAQ